MKVVITRPRLDAVALRDVLLRLGHRVVDAPLLEIVPRDGVQISPLKFQALCVTSANGVRCLTNTVDLDIAVFAVGPQSAEAARAKGFSNVSAQGGDVNGLSAFVAEKLKPGDGPLLYVAGAETSGDLAGQLRAAGFKVERLVTYDAVAETLDGADLVDADAVLLYSPRTAKLWVSEMQRLGMVARAAQMNHFCLSPNVAAQLPKAWRSLVAKTPTERSLLGLLENQSEEA